MDRAEKASAMMRERRGNCAQSVFTAFSAGYGVDEKAAFNLAQAFGAGMNQDNLCGAVSGAYMALGLGHPVARDNPQVSLDKTKAMQKEFNRRFKERHGGLNCTEILGYNLTDPAQVARAREEGLFVSVCPEFVYTAVKIVEEMLKEGK